MIREELKAALDSAKELFGIPSYSATCYYKGETFSFSNGICSIESNEEVNGDTMYAIGSCTKIVTLVGKFLYFLHHFKDIFKKK